MATGLPVLLSSSIVAKPLSALNIKANLLSGTMQTERRHNYRWSSLSNHIHAAAEITIFHKMLSIKVFSKFPFNYSINTYYSVKLI